jgi:hypothetical protein
MRLASAGAAGAARWSDGGDRSAADRHFFTRCRLVRFLTPHADPVIARTTT